MAFAPRSTEAAPFNMALATLERLSDILVDIKKVSADFFLPPNQKQQAKVFLVKQFFLQASPLLKVKTVEEYKQKFLDLKPNSLPILKKNSSGIAVRTDDVKNFFDWELETKLDEMILDIQMELQTDGYFMPPKQDMGSVMGRLG